MPTVKELYDCLNKKIPPSLSCEWDNDGLMVCADTSAEVKRVLLALDATDAVAKYAAENGFDTIVTHHPMIFSPLRSLTELDPTAKKALFLAEKGISVMSFHTRLDAAQGGVNDVLASKLGVLDTHEFGPDGEKLGRVGTLESPVDFRAFCLEVARALGSPFVSAIGEEGSVSRVALLGGGGKDFVKSAFYEGADVFVTGEVTYNVMLDAKAMGLRLVTAGHYHTERPVLSAIDNMIRESFGDIDIREYPYDTEIFAVRS